MPLAETTPTSSLIHTTSSKTTLTVYTQLHIDTMISLETFCASPEGI